MRHDWIVSISLGASIKFQCGPTRESLKEVELGNLSNGYVPCSAFSQRGKMEHHLSLLEIGIRK